MKHLKKLASLLLAMVMVFGLAATALASATEPGTDPAPTDTTDPTPAPTPAPLEGELPGGSITINNAVAGHTYSIYQILYLESYNAETKAYSYKANSQWENWLKDQTDYVAIDEQGYVTWIAEDKEDNSPTVVEFARLALKHAKDAGIQPNKTAIAPEVENPSVTFNELQLGYYLVDSTLGTLCSLDTTNPDVEMLEKNDEPTNEKEVEEGGVYGSVNDANIGDPVEFRSKVTLPAGSENVIYHDTMSNGLTFNDDITVVEYTSTIGEGGTEVITEGKKLTLGDNADYKVTYNVTHDGKTCTFEVVFNPSYLKKPIGTNADTDRTEKVLIKYTATINANAVIGGNGNPNESHLSYGDEDNTQVTPPSKTTTYVWEFGIYKYTGDIEGEHTPLADAEFVLLRKYVAPEESETPVVPEEPNQVAIFDANYKLVRWENIPAAVDGVTTWPAGSILVTPAGGKINVKGLDSGTYYLREIKAPDGYNMLADDVLVEITPDELKPTEGDEEPIGYGGDKLTLDMNPIDVLNNTGSELPSTGGIGTTIFYVVGSILLVGAVVLLVVKKRMSVSK